MAVVSVQMLAGRSLEQKRHLVASITDAMANCVGASRASVNVIINEIPAASWARGGQLFSERGEGADDLER